MDKLTTLPAPLARPRAGRPTREQAEALRRDAVVQDALLRADRAVAARHLGDLGVDLEAHAPAVAASPVGPHGAPIVDRHRCRR